MGVIARIVIMLALLPFLILTVVYALMPIALFVPLMLAALFAANIVAPLIVCLFRPSWIARRVSCASMIIFLALALTTFNPAAIAVYVLLYVYSAGLLSLKVVRRYVGDEVLFTWGGPQSFFSRAIFARVAAAELADG